MKKHFLTALKLFVSIGGLVFIFFMFRDKWPEVIQVFQEFNPAVFLLACACYFFALFIITFRLQALLIVHRLKLSIPYLYYLGGVGQFFSLFLPSAIGGDAVKGFYIYKKTGKKVPAFTSLFLDRLVGSMAIATFAICALLYFSRHMNLGVIRNGVWFVFSAILFGLCFLFSKKFAKRFKFLSFLIPGRKLKEFMAFIYHEINYYANHKKILAKVFFISVAAQIVFISVQYILALSLNIRIPYLNFYLVIPIVSAMSMVPSIGGLGVREAGFLMFGLFTTREKAIALSIANLMLVCGTGFLFGIIYMVKDGFQYKVIKDAMKTEEQMEKLESQSND